MPRLELQKVTRVYNAAPEDQSEASARRSKKAHTRATQQALLGADLPPSAAATVVNAAYEAKRYARAAEIARTAMGLRSLALAAAALRKLPGGGALADTLLRSLDASVNKGGKIRVKGNQLVRVKPTMRPDGSVQIGFFDALVSIAPSALAKVGPAIAAAKAGMQRFGSNLNDNVKAAASWVADKATVLLDAAQQVPGIAPSAAFAAKALATAKSVFGSDSAQSKDDDATASVKSAKTKQVRRIVKRSFSQVRPAPAPGALATSQPPPPSSSNWLETAKTYAPYALGAFLAAKVFL